MQDNQYIALKKQSRQVQTALDMTHGKLRAIEDDLANFLDDYYAKVGAAFEQLAALQQELESVRSGCFELKPADVKTQEPLSKSDGSLKQFYRDMARDCHPDSAAAQHPEAQALKAEMMKTLNAAYARKSLSEMWQLKWELERQKQDGTLSHAQRLELLQTQQAQMQTTLEELQQREGELKQSAAYQLMQHARLMECCGQDFIAMVKGRVARQMDETKRELRAARHQARYWQHVRMG